MNVEKMRHQLARSAPPAPGLLFAGRPLDADTAGLLKRRFAAAAKAVSPLLVLGEPTAVGRRPGAPVAGREGAP